ncbi:MAG: FHA domain-containing protein [Clostridiales bacterium]|nr:FHA domain-containing protein [Clostridiales bacterium]
MGEFRFENQGNHTWLIYAFGEEDVIDTVCLGMLTNNRIPGLAESLYNQMDHMKMMKYRVSSKVTVRQFLTGMMNKKRVTAVFLWIVNAILSAEDYMIEPDSILLDPDYMFVDVSTCETALICVPVKEKLQPDMNLRMFFKNIVVGIQYDPMENGDYVTRILNYLNCQTGFSLPDFKKLLNEIDCPSDSLYSDPEKEKQRQNRKESVPARASDVKQVWKKEQQVVIVGGKMEQQLQPHSEKMPVSSTAPGKSTVEEKPEKAEERIQIPPAVVSEYPETDGEKGAADIMSLAYLLQHYNKENAAIYKAQKRDKKSSEYSGKKKNKKATETNRKHKKASNECKIADQGGFVIPGKDVHKEQNLYHVRDSEEQNPHRERGQGNGSAGAGAQRVKQPDRPDTGMGTDLNYLDRTILSESVGFDKTLVSGMDQNAVAVPYLLRLRNDEKILLDKPVFRIGTRRDYADYCIRDNPTVSRSHATILIRDGKYYVLDTNSSNHTYVDGRMISSNVETELSHGMRLKFSNEEFEFRMFG